MWKTPLSANHHTGGKFYEQDKKKEVEKEDKCVANH